MSTAPGPLVIVDARTRRAGASGALLDDLGTATVLELQLRRLAAVHDDLGATLVVGTSGDPIDDPIVDAARALGVAAVRGPADDVVTTIALAHVRFPTAEVVALPGASPLHDPFLVRAALELHRQATADVTTNLLPRSFPRGLDVTVLDARALRVTELEATGAEREHPAAHAARRPHRFRLANLRSGHDAGRERWQVEEPDDLARLRDLVAQVRDVETASWSRILAVAGRAAPARPGQVVLAPGEATEPGACPWVQHFEVLLDGRALGTATVTVDGEGVHREVDVPGAHREAATAALYATLLHDLQAGT